MSQTLYIGNATTQDLLVYYRPTNQSPMLPGGGNPNVISVPRGTVVSKDFPGDTGAAEIIPQLAPYLGEWSGSGTGYSLSPITL